MQAISKEEIATTNKTREKIRSERPVLFERTDACKMS